MGDFLNRAWHFLFSWVNREFFIFLFFLAVAGIFWLLTTLNENFEQEVKIPVKFVHVPKNVVLTSGEDDTLRFTVRDTGVGMDREFLPMLFTAFSQEDASTTNRFGGSGMGLPVAQAIARHLIRSRRLLKQIDPPKGAKPKDDEEAPEA